MQYHLRSQPSWRGCLVFGSVLFMVAPQQSRRALSSWAVSSPLLRPATSTLLPSTFFFYRSVLFVYSARLAHFAYAHQTRRFVATRRRKKKNRKDVCEHLFVLLKNPTEQKPEFEKCCKQTQTCSNLWPQRVPSNSDLAGRHPTRTLSLGPVIWKDMRRSAWKDTSKWQTINLAIEQVRRLKGGVRPPGSRAQFFFVFFTCVSFHIFQLVFFVEMSFPFLCRVLKIWFFFGSNAYDFW